MLAIVTTKIIAFSGMIQRNFPETDLIAWCMASLGDEIDNCELFLEQRRRHIFCSGKLSMQQPEHARILPAKVQPLNFLGQPDEERPSKHQP